MITTQLTPDLPDKKVNCACAREATLGYCVKHVTVGNARGAHLQEQTARIFLVLEQIRGNLSSYLNSAESLY